MKTFIAFSVIAVCMLSPHAAGAELTTMHLDSDVQLVELLSDTMFVSEGRIGDLGGHQTFELDLGQSTGAPVQTADYAWQNGAIEPFSVTYDSGTGLVTFSLGGVTLFYTTPYFDFDVVIIRARAVNEGTSITVSDLVLDGEDTGDGSGASGPDGLDILLVLGGFLNDGFTLNGSAVLSWTGAPPTHSQLAFQVKVAKIGTIGVQTESWGAIKQMRR